MHDTSRGQSIGLARAQLKQTARVLLTGSVRQQQGLYTAAAQFQARTIGINWAMLQHEFTQRQGSSGQDCHRRQDEE